MRARKAFRDRVCPTPAQAARLRAWEGALRYLWNLAHEQRLMAHGRRCKADARYPTAFDQINELTEAWAIVNAFQGGNVRQGEYLLTNGFNFGVYIDPSTYRTLAQKDFDRTMPLIDGLRRREMRILILTSLLEGGF